MTRMLVCGGRDFRNWALLMNTLDRLAETRDISAVIEGKQRGADRMAGIWARNRGMEPIEFPADWDAYGKSAGPIRNRRMLAEARPDLVVAFPTGGPGTQDMMKIARKAGIEVIEISTKAELMPLFEEVCGRTMSDNNTLPESQYIDPDGEVQLKPDRSSVHDTRDRTGYIQPSDPSIVADYWVTRRRADTIPGYDLELPDIREIYRWNGSAWITGQGRFDPILSCLHSNNGWRIEGPVDVDSN